MMNEKNENMELEVVDTYEEPEMAEETSGGSGFGLGLAIGAGLTLLIGAGVKKAKTVYAKFKDRKKADEAIPDSNVVDIADGKPVQDVPEDETEE